MSRRESVMAYVKRGYTEAWLKGDDGLATALHRMYSKFEQMGDDEWLEHYESEEWDL